jgi:hypothetical protein
LKPFQEWDEGTDNYGRGEFNIIYCKNFDKCHKNFFKKGFKKVDIEIKYRGPGE